MTAVAPVRPEAPSGRQPGRDRAAPQVADTELHAAVHEILNRHAAVGLAVGVVRRGRRTFFHCHGLAGIASKTSISTDTVFRIGSITKLFTAIAIMQLVEQGRVDLDAPANDYLRAYRLIPEQAGWRPATLRHLLTHTAGIPEVRGLADLLQSDLTPSGGRPAHLSVKFGEPLPSLGEYYRDGLRVVVEPGTAFAYTNHGFATLGQIVEDVSGLPLERYLHERVLEPMGMGDTDLVRSERLASGLATGYVVGRSGAKAVPDRDWTGRGAGGMYATTRDMGRFAAALLAGGQGEHGRILGGPSLATMFDPHYQPDPRIPGIGLAFFRGDIGGHRTAGHDGILPGFNSALLIAPDDGLGVVAFTNGSRGAVNWLQIELARLMRHLLGVPDDIVRSDIPHHPDRWADLCGRYVLQPRIGDLRGRLTLNGGAEVFITGGRVRVRFLTPLPVPLHGLSLDPDDEHDPDVFRLDLSRLGMASPRVVFSRDAGGRATAAHVDLAGQPWSLVRQHERGPGLRWLGPALAALAAGGLAAAVRRGGGRQPRHRVRPPSFPVTGLD